MNFGEKLQILRKERGLSQEQFAAQLMVSRQAISKWELGESKPDIDKIIQISNVFNVSIDYLLKDEEQSSNTDKNTLHCEKNHLSAQILFIGSVAFLAIGLFCAFGGWYEEQSPEAIWGSMIIQVIGVVAYFIGRTCYKTTAPFAISILNIEIAVFMPISIVVSALFGKAISPYPTDAHSLILFLIGYVIVMLVSVVILKKSKN